MALYKSVYYFLNPQYLIPEGKILTTKQVRPQRRLLGGESAVEGDRITPLESYWHPLEQVSCFPGVFSDAFSRGLSIIIIIIIITMSTLVRPLAAPQLPVIGRYTVAWEQNKTRMRAIAASPSAEVSAKRLIRALPVIGAARRRYRIDQLGRYDFLLVFYSDLRSGWNRGYRRIQQTVYGYRSPRKQRR